MRVGRNKRVDLRLLNTIRILKYVRKHHKTTKPTIAKALGISTPTVSSLVDQLIEDGFIETVGLGESTDQGGKPPKIISFIPTSRAIISIYIGIGVVDVALMDLHSTILGREKTKEIGTSKEALLQSVIIKTKNMIKKAKQLNIPILGIGVGSLGLIETKTGIIRKATNYSLIDDLPIKEKLTEEFGLTVMVDNECNNLALAELFFGTEQVQTFISLTTDSGIGAGIIINNQIMRGIDDSFGEIGHTSIHFDGRMCTCGNKGCWETYASSFALINDIAKRLKETTHLKKWIKEKDEITIPLIVRALREGDEVVKQVAIDELGTYLGIGLANIINTFNPELIIIHGEMTALGEPLMMKIKEEIRRRSFPISAKRVKIKKSRLTDEAQLLGAGALVLKEFFENPSCFSRNPYYLSQFKESGNYV